MEGESRQHYELLRRGFMEQFKPVGAVEEVFVERLAILELRHQRLIIAEGAEVRQRTWFMNWDQDMKYKQELSEAGYETNLENLSLPLLPVGLLHKTENPRILAVCIKYLSDLRERIEKNGFDYERDWKVLAILNGGPLCIWKKFSEELQEAENKRQRGEPVSSPFSKQSTLEELADDIRSLKAEATAQAEVLAERANMKLVSLIVPESPNLERFMHYETHLSRERDRLLNQLERVQRMRRGQPAPPTLNVQVT
jgi:predicted  nucleic acid-binding Zn-ribbon protein